MLHREASHCRVHEEEGNGAGETRDAAARSSGLSREVFLAKQSPWVLEEADVPAARSGRAGEDVLCQQFDQTIPDLNAEASEQGRGGREWVHRVSIWR